jgi:3-methyladenine DNA glycosylase Tag
MSLEYIHSSYGKSGWFVRIDQKDEARIKNALADAEMTRFQDSLDSFAWAIQNAPR